MASRPWKRLALGFLAITMILSACGKAPSGGTAAKKTLLDEIKARGYITVATSGDNAPTSFANEKNEIIGLDADWAQIVADHLGVKVQFKRLEFKGIIPGLLAGTFDVGMSGINVTEERLKTIAFSEHYGYEEVVAIFPESRTDIHSVEDIKGKVVGVVTGSTNGEVPVREVGGFKDIKLYPGIAELFQDLKNERTEVVVTGKIMAGHWTNTEGKGYKLSEKGLAGRKIAIAMRQDVPELQAAINEAIQKAKANGKYEELAKKWIGTTFSQ